MRLIEHRRHAARERLEFSGRMRDRRGDGEDIAFERHRHRFERRGFLGLGALALGGARLLGVAQPQSIVAEHRDRARHGADLVGPPVTLDRNGEMAAGHLRHRLRHAAQRPGDKKIASAKMRRSAPRQCRRRGRRLWCEP